jgi:very-short-patch-repair endonuclease
MRGPNDFKTERARLLRLNSTTAERRLWYRLRSRSINGHKFVRQEPIGRFIVDFVCREKRLIVELDGSQHADSRAMRSATNGSSIAAIASCDSGTTT